MRMCQRCNKRPAEKQEPHWLPICQECSDTIFDLPHDQMIAVTQAEWDKYLASELYKQDVEGMERG